MIGYLKFLYEKNFKSPELLTNDKDHRAASTLELFMDLAFVGALSSLVHFLVGADHINGNVIYGFMLRYGSVFAIWYNLVWYNNLYENKTMRHRLIMLLIILSVIGQQVAFNAENSIQYHFLLISYSFSRFLELFLWITSTYNKKNKNILLKKSSIFYMLGIGYSAIFPLLFFNTKVNYFVWTSTVIMELILPTILFNIIVSNAQKKGCKEIIPVHNELFIERFGLLFLLVLGEGIVSLTNVMSHFEYDLMPTIRDVLIIGLIIYGIWESYYDIVLGEQNKYDPKYIIHWSFLNMIMCLGITMAMGTVGEIIHPHHKENLHILMMIHLIGIAIYNICLHIVISFRDERIKQFSFINNKIILDKQAIKFARKVYFFTGIILLIIAFIPNLNVTITLGATFLSSIQFLFVKQYVAYKSFEKGIDGQNNDRR